MIVMKRTGMIAALAAVSLTLGGCISLGGGEPPESLLTLSPIAGEAPDGVAQAAEDKGAIAIITPDVPAKLDVLRVPVAVSDTEIAYLQEAFWVEKPARLFRRLIGESLRRADQGALVFDGEDLPNLPKHQLRGTLLDMTYVAGESAVVVRYDAIYSDSEGKITTRRFEAREEGVLPQARDVGPALNRVSNTVADEAAAWVLQQIHR